MNPWLENVRRTVEFARATAAEQGRNMPLAARQSERLLGEIDARQAKLDALSALLDNPGGLNAGDLHQKLRGIVQG